MILNSVAGSPGDDSFGSRTDPPCPFGLSLSKPCPFLGRLKKDGPSTG
jgi:hypothetical protein